MLKISMVKTEKNDTQRCKWSKKVTNFLNTIFNKITKHNCEEMIL